jgi:hypothetical protein
MKHVGVRLVHQRRQRAAEQPATLTANPLAQRIVGIENVPDRVERDVADRGLIVERLVAIAAGHELELRATQLLVLHLELGLVHAQLVQQAAEVHALDRDIVAALVEQVGSPAPVHRFSRMFHGSASVS